MTDFTFLSDLVTHVNGALKSPFIAKPLPTSEGPAAVVHNGRIYWRGTGHEWVRLQPEQAYRLRGLFSMDSSASAAGFVRDLTDALDEYEGAS